MTGAMSRRKGATFERLIRKALEAWIYNYTHPGTDEPDLMVECGLDIAVECKNQARTDLPGWWRQATEAAERADADAAVIVHKRQGVTAPDEQWVSMNLATFARLLHEIDRRVLP